MKILTETKKTFNFSYVLAKNQIKTKNEYNLLGFFWYILDPIFLFFIFMIIRGNLGKHTEFTGYPIYLFLGLIMFNFFRRCTSSSTGAITSKGRYLRIISVPKESFVISNVFVNIFSHIFEILILVVFLLYFGLLGFSFSGYLFIFILFAIFTTGVSFIVSTIGIYIRDFSGFWRIFTRLVWFLTPIFYVLQENNLLYKLNQFNPIFHFIETARFFLVPGYDLNYTSLILSIIIPIVTLVIGVLFFRKYRDYFAELL